MLEINALSKSFLNNTLFDNFSFRLDTNGVYLLRGANGVGKTTLLKLIKGILLPDQGSIRFQNKEVCFGDVAYIDSNNRSFFHRLSVWQNIDYFSALNKHFVEKDRVFNLLRNFGMSNLLLTEFSKLSSGQMQIIAFIRAVCAKPNILLMDESLSNLDASRITQVCAHLSQFVVEKSKIVILCSHDKNLPIKFSGVIDL